MNKFVKQTAVGVTATIILVAFFFLAAVFASHPAFSQASNTATKESFCMSIIQHHDKMMDAARKRNIPVRWRIFRNSAADRFISEYNKIPPETTLQGDAVGIFVFAGSPNVFISIETNHCITANGELPIISYIALIKASKNELGRV